MAAVLPVPSANFAAGSIAVALAVLALKAAAGWLTGSVALYSDALEVVHDLGHCYPVPSVISDLDGHLIHIHSDFM